MARQRTRRKKNEPSSNKAGNGANLGFEAKLWAAADKLRGHMDAAVYKHVVLGLIFLKYISDAFQEKFDELEATRETEYTDPEDRDEYTAANIFWVPKQARWSRLQANAKQPTDRQTDRRRAGGDRDRSSRPASPQPSSSAYTGCCSRAGPAHSRLALHFGVEGLNGFA